MIVVYILILTLCHTINGTYKAKRDLADLKNDPLLASVFEFKHDDRRSLNQTISTADQFQKRDTTDTTLLPELMTLNKEANESSPNEPIISNPVDLPESDSSAIYSLSPMSSSDSAVSPDLVASNFLPLPSETPEVSKKSNVLRGSSQPLQLTVHSPNADIMGIAPHITEYDKEKKSKVEDESKDKKQFIPQVPMMNNMYYQQYQTPQFANFMQQSPMNVQQSAIQQVFPQQNMLMQQAYSNPTSQELQAPQQVVSQQAVQQLQQLQQQKVEQQTVQTAQTAQQTAQQAAKETPSTEGPCTDQYAMCNEFAKNNYCTNYPQLMKIQCRKACAFCVAPENKTEPAPSKVEPALTKKSHHHKNKTATPAVTVVTHHQETGSGDAMIEGSGSGEPAAKVTKKTEKVAQHKSSSKKASKKHDILQERHHTDELNGSGSGVSEEIGSGEAESGSGATESIDAPPKVIKVKVVPTKQNNTKLQGKKSSKDAKTKKIKQVKEVKTVRSNIPENNVPQLHSNLGEFTLPAKKSHAPASSLAFADKNDDDDSGSGSGSGDDGGYVQVKSKIVAKKISAAKNKSVKKAPKTANVVKPTFKPALKNTKGKNSTAQKKSTKATDIKTTKKIENKKKEKNQKKSTVPAPVKQKTNKKKDSHKKSKVKQNGNKKKQKSRKGKKKSATKLSAPSATQKKDVVPSPPQVAPPSVMAFGSSYPRIDLRAIATALAKYESAALELAGEYPKPSQFDMTEYQRSSIPHPRQPAIVNPRQHFIDNEKAAKFVEADLQKKNVIPKYLRISKEAKDTDEVPKDSADADSLDSVRQRFLIPGVEPTLNDYYSETGKINPFASKTKNYKKSRIVRRMNSSADPYEYLRNMVPGSSMEPIADPHKRNNILSDHSYPVFLMKVSPADKKYKPEEASKRGKVHRVNAEGLPVDESKTHPAPAPAAFQPMIPAALAAPLTMPMFNPFAAMQAPPPAPFVPPSQAYFAAPQQPAAPVAFYQPPPASPVAQPSPQNAAIAPPLDFTVDQLTVPQTNAAFSKEEQITPEKQPGANSLRSKMLSAFFNVKTGENEDEGSGGGSGDGSLRNHEGSGGGEDATGSRKSMTLHNLFSDEDVGANYLKSNLAALTPEKPSDAATHVQMSKTQETNWMRPNPQSELASAMPFPEQQTALPTEAASFQPISREQENAIARDNIPSKQTSKSIMQADFFTQASNKRKKILSKKLFQSLPSYEDLAISHLKSDHEKSLMMEFPKSPFTRDHINSSPINEAVQTDKQLLNTFYQPKDNSFARSNIFQQSFQPTAQEQPPPAFHNAPTFQIPSEQASRAMEPSTSNIEPPHLTSAGVYPEPTSQFHATIDSSSPLEVGSHDLEETSHSYEKPVQRQFSKQESSSLTAEAGAADYQMNSRSGLPSQTISTNDAHTGMNYIVPPPVEIQPLTLTLSSAPAKPHFEQDVRKNLIRQEPELDCGESWEGARGDFGTFCYKQMKMKATFDDALAECRRMESDLFSVLNAYENRYLQDNIHEKFWIGYRDRGMDGNWNWTDGGRSIYTNWGKHSGGDEKRFDCVYMDGEEGQWKDAACNKKQQFLCKKKTQNCPKDWKSLKLNTALGCYKMFEKLSSWEDAERSCQENGAHLASLISDNEQTMVYQVYSSKTFWIGFNDRESEGDWVWSDRMTSSFTNWAAKSPSNGGVSCASMISGGEWHDDPCAEKLQFICKKKGPGKPEKIDGTDSDGVLLPVARLMNRPETKPSHIYDELAKGGSRPVTPKYFWPLLKTSHPGLAGNRPMAAHGDVRLVPGGVALDGIHGFLDGGDFHGKCVADPEKCSKGFAIAIHVFFDKSVRAYKTAHCVVDTSGGSKGFTIFIESNKLNYRVVTETRTWNLRTDLAVESWQQIVMSWHKDKGISVFVNGALKEVESSSKKSDIKTQGPARLIIGREDKDKGPYTCTKMVVASVAIFTKVLTVEDVPFAFTYGDTVVASYRWLMTNLQDGIVPGAPEVEVNHNPINVDGGIFIDGNSNWLEIDDIDPLIGDPFSKSKHGFSVSFKVKFDQRVREYKQARYIMDSGGHIGGVRGISVYVVNDNLYFQVVDSPDEDILIWKVRAPIYTVRWQRVLMTWRLDKGLWVYLDGAFRGYTKTPTTLPEQLKDTPKKLIVGRNSVGPDYMGAQFAFGCLALYGRYLPRKDADLVFGGADSPFPGIVREVWKNTPGENITTLEANPDYPNSPSTIEIIENFDAPFNVDNDYGSKLKGYFVAPETGNTTFYLACSKACQLFFSADEESKNKTRIAALDRPTWHNQWNKYANQSAHDIYLVAGKYYFLEAIHKGVDASDSLSVGVRLPTGRLQRPISIENLQWRLPGNEHAGLIREVWYDLPGYSIVDLNSNINFPSKPSTTEVVDKFDAPFNVDDNYGARISGYFHAPDTGEYRFYLATDSSGELWLSTDDQENNLVKIVTLNGWTDHNQWLKYPEQKSSKIFLVSGRNYFIRAYMKADKLGDCASVAVELPSGHFEGPIKKKHLSWKLTNTNEGPGPKEIIEPLPKPVGLYTLNDASVKDILLPGDNKLILGDVDLTTGPFGVKDDAFLFKGNRSSYIEIPNDGRLDVRHSITLLANVFPTGEDGPIINYKRDGWGVHLWQFSGTQLFVRFVTRDGKMTAQPMGTRVLQLNKWNQVGASYNHNSGVAQLWHDGKMVKSRNIGQLELSTNASVRLGAKEGDDRYFRGKMSCVQIYDRALTADQVGEVRHCPNKNGANESAGEELTVFGQGSGMEQIYEESEAMENRIGEDTEEELIVSRCDPSPCVNEGTCVDDDKKIDGYKCVCRHQYAGKHCQVSKESAPVVKRTVIPSPTNTTPDSSKREDVTMLYQKLGCYKDDSVNRDLKAKMSLSQATQESCVHACAKDDVTFSYFGLQNGQSCFCGASYGKYGKIADTFCDRKCEGNPDEDCGGELASNLFFFGANKNYTIKTFTGKQSGAGTDAKIFAEFIGDRGNSGFRQLDSKLDKYEPGSIDTLQFSLPDLGNLKRMKILHDNTGTAPSWFLEKVDVTDSSGHVTEFPCNDWLSETQSGGKLERELLARSTISRPS